MFASPKSAQSAPQTDSFWFVEFFNLAMCCAQSSRPKGTVCVIGAPLSHGQTLQGVDKAPKTLRDNGLSRVIEKLGWVVNDIGDLQFRHKLTTVDTPHVSAMALKPTLRDVKTAEYTEEEVPKCRLIGEACGQLADAVYDAAKRNEFVLTIGGDHSIASGSISGMLSAHPDLVVLWVDAHGDINTPESSPSRLYHGMPVAHLVGMCKKQIPGFEWMNSAPVLAEDNLAFIGLRDIDAAERDIILNSKVHAFSMKDVDCRGIADVVRQALKKIDPEGKRPIHLSFDIDGCDPSIAPGTGTKARGGLSYREAHYICESLFETGRLVSMDLVEINPDRDQPDEFLHGDDPSISETASKTVRFGLELISSVLGKVIL